MVGMLSSSLGANEKLNVLFIPVDDLKPMLGCYGNSRIKTPNFDRLAQRGTVFTNAHCQQAVCGPSRASLLTGWRPDRTQVWDLKTKIRDINPEVVTLPQYFKENGYETVGLGKTYDFRSVESRAKDDPRSWSRPYGMFASSAESGYQDSELISRIIAIKEKQGNEGDGWRSVIEEMGGIPATEGSADLPDDAYDDGVFAREGVKLIHELGAGEKPFFLSVGFKKPHLPFVAPKKYWDLYERNEIDLERYQKMPDGAPKLHFQDSWELKNGTYAGYRPGQPITEEQQRELIHGYMACVSYIDAQLGKLLDALSEAGVENETVVAVWGDHGFHLGDHGMFCKHTNYEQATRVPLIFAKPQGKGNQCESPVEFVDVYPTLCELAGLPVPSDLDGVSLSKLLDDPQAKVKNYAVSQYPRGGSKNTDMGYAFRDERFRYIEWVKKDDIAGKVIAREFYDYQNDPLETVNAIDSADYREQITRMEQWAADFLGKGEME